MLENTWSVGARCLLQSHLNSQQAAWHSHVTGKSLGSSHSSHRCIIISQTNFGYIIVMYELLGCFFCCFWLVPPLFAGLSAYLTTCHLSLGMWLQSSVLSLFSHCEPALLPSTSYMLIQLLSLHLDPAGTMDCPASWGEAVHEQCGPEVRVHLCPSQA